MYLYQIWRMAWLIIVEVVTLSLWNTTSKTAMNVKVPFSTKTRCTHSAFTEPPHHRLDVTSPFTFVHPVLKIKNRPFAASCGHKANRTPEEVNILPSWCRTSASCSTISRSSRTYLEYKHTKTKHLWPGCCSTSPITGLSRRHQTLVVYGPGVWLFTSRSTSYPQCFFGQSLLEP